MNVWLPSGMEKCSQRWLVYGGMASYSQSGKDWYITCISSDNRTVWYLGSYSPETRQTLVRSGLSPRITWLSPGGPSQDRGALVICRLYWFNLNHYTAYAGSDQVLHLGWFSYIYMDLPWSLLIKQCLNTCILLIYLNEWNWSTSRINQGLAWGLGFPPTLGSVPPRQEAEAVIFLPDVKGWIQGIGGSFLVWRDGSSGSGVIISFIYIVHICKHCSMF